LLISRSLPSNGSTCYNTMPINWITLILWHNIAPLISTDFYIACGYLNSRCSCQFQESFECCFYWTACLWATFKCCTFITHQLSTNFAFDFSTVFHLLLGKICVMLFYWCEIHGRRHFTEKRNVRGKLPDLCFNSEFNVYNLYLDAALMIKVYLLQYLYISVRSFS
jgi:hypothetical protein